MALFTPDLILTLTLHGHALRIGQAVRWLFKPSVGEYPVPLFTPV
jgi:hypothetical protein